MLSSKSKHVGSKQRGKSSVVTYRGIRVLKTAGSSKFDEGTLKKAVEAALNKNASFVSRRSKA